MAGGNTGISDPRAQRMSADGERPSNGSSGMIGVQGGPVSDYAPGGRFYNPAAGIGGEVNPVTRMPRSNEPQYASVPQQPQRSQAYGMPQQQQPMYQNSGMARFGAGFNPYMPQAYQPRVYQPRTLAPSRGLISQQPAQGVGGGLMGGPADAGGNGTGTAAPSGPGTQGIDPNGFNVTAHDVFGLVTNPIATVVNSVANNVNNVQSHVDSINAAANDASPQNPSGINAVNGMDSDSDNAGHSVDGGGPGAGNGGNGQGGPAQGSNDGPGDSPGDSGGGGGGGGK